MHCFSCGSYTDSTYKLDGQVVCNVCFMKAKTRLFVEDKPKGIPVGKKNSRNIVFPGDGVEYDLQNDFKNPISTGVIISEAESAKVKLDERKEEKQVGKIIKAGQVQEVDKPNLPQAQAAVTATPEPADIDAMIAEMEVAVRDAEAILDLATKHRDAAVQIILTLGPEKAGDIVKAIRQQLSQELAAIWRQEAV